MVQDKFMKAKLKLTCMPSKAKNQKILFIMEMPGHFQGRRAFVQIIVASAGKG